MKVKESESHSVVSDSLRPRGLYGPQNSPGQNTGVCSLSPSPGDLLNPGIETMSSTLKEDSLPAEPQGKPKNTGVGSLFIFQQIFQTQESNWGLQHCRQIPLHKASYIRQIPLYNIIYRYRYRYKYRYRYISPSSKFPT